MRFLITILMVCLFTGCSPVDNRPLSKYQIEQRDKRWERRRQYNNTKRAVKDALREHEREKRR